MITKMPSAVPGRVQITFELPCCLWADRIYLTGEFNDWDRSSLPMHQTRDGVWRIVLDLPCDHTYEFRYLVDDHWLTDSHADGARANPYGTQNSMVDTALPVMQLQLGVDRKQSDPVWWEKRQQLSYAN